MQKHRVDVLFPLSLCHHFGVYPSGLRGIPLCDIYVHRETFSFLFFPPSFTSFLPSLLPFLPSPSRSISFSINGMIFLCWFAICFFLLYLSLQRFPASPCRSALFLDGRSVFRSSDTPSFISMINLLVSV